MALIKGLPVLVYDLEVFKYNYMAVFKDSETGEYYCYHNSVDRGWHFPNREAAVEGLRPPVMAVNAPAMDELINKYWLCGYNNLGYDNIIVTAMLKNPNPQNVKLRNDALFKHMADNNLFNRTKRKNQKRKYTDNKRFPVFRSIKSIDAMQEIVADEFKDSMFGIPLKYIQGNMGINIHESSVDFNIQRQLTDDEVYDTFLYCMSDVDTTEDVMNARWDGYFVPKMNLCDRLDDWGFEFSMTQRTTTLTGHLLRNKNKFNFDAMLDKMYEDGLMLPSMYEYWKRGYNKDDENDDGLVLDLFDNEIKFKWGGIHGVHRRLKFFEGDIYHIDVASMYPSIIILLGILGEEVTKLYKSIRDQRVDDKHKVDQLKEMIDLIEDQLSEEGQEEIKRLKEEIKYYAALADGAKLILNKLYGILGSETSKVSNIKGLNAICVYGQVAMYNIGKLVSPYGTIIQFNTDGIYFLPFNSETTTKDVIREILKPWEEAFQLEMDIEDFVTIAQRDVNTYVAGKADGTFKTKGEISSSKKNWANMFKNWNASVVEKAVVEKITKGTPIHETVNNETDLTRFMYVTKNTRAYRGVVNMTTGVEESQHINRYFVVHSGGAVYKKVKPTKVEELIKRKKKLESKISELEVDMPAYLRDKENKELYPTKKALAKKWKTGPEKKISNAQASLKTIEETIERIERGEDVVTYSKITGMPEVGDKVLLHNGDVNNDTTDLLFKIDRQHYINAAEELAGKFGV